MAIIPCIRSINGDQMKTTDADANMNWHGESTDPLLIQLNKLSSSTW